jgi:hypothetical protein
MPAGSYDLSAQRFTGAYNPPPEPVSLTGSTGSNFITLLMGPLDSSVVIQYSLVDHDLNQRSNETICSESVTLTASPTEWAGMNRNLDLGSTGTPCRITVNVSGGTTIRP